MNLKKTLSSFLVAIFFLLLFWKIAQGFQEIKDIHWKLEPKYLIPLVLVILPGPFVNAFSWHQMTKFLGGKISFKDNFIIWTYSNAARFFPGSIWQYAGRVYMLSQKGVSKTFTASALLLEALLNITTAIVIVMLTLNLKTLALPPILQKSLVPLILLIFFVVIIFGTGRIVFLQKTLKATLKKNVIKLTLSGMKLAPLIIVSVFAQFLLAGVALFFTAKIANISASSVHLNLGDTLPFVGIYAASWLIGYLAFLAPSGLGVREASIAGLLTSFVPLAVGGLIAILFRFATLVSEALTVFMVFLITKKKSPLN